MLNALGPKDLSIFVFTCMSTSLGGKRGLRKREFSDKKFYIQDTKLHVQVQQPFTQMKTKFAICL